MNAKDYILSKRVPRHHDLTIELADGVSARFLIPLSGVGRSSLERQALEFSRGKPNAIFVQQGIMPPEGFDENVAYGLFLISATNQEGWNQTDVLEMFNEAPDEMMAIFSKLTTLAYAKKAEAENQEVEDELGNSEEIQPTVG